jgi:hypothetical protein
VLFAPGFITPQSHSGICNPDLYRQNTNKQKKMKFRILATLAAIASFTTPALAAPRFADEARAAIAVTNARVSALEDTATRKAVGVGSYVGAGVNLNRQGVSSDTYSNNRTIAGGTLQGRFPVAEVYGTTVSARPYVNFAAGPDSQIGSAIGVLGTVDVSLAGRTIGGTYVSGTNLYLGAGGQWALTNDGEANYQTSIGQGSQFVFVAGVERSFTPSLVGFADLKFPTQENGVTGTAYAPVGTVGLGFKF